MKYSWVDESNNVKHYYRTSDGKILGTIWQYVNNHRVWVSKILEEEFPFTNASEKFIGHYIDQDSARRSVERFWDIEDNTLLEDHR